MNERLLNPISNAELDRRWAAVRAAMAERRVDALVVQSNNDWLGGYAKWLTDHPATNGYPKSVIFYADDFMTVVDMGPRGGRRKLGGNDEVHRGVGEILTTPALPRSPIPTSTRPSSSPASSCAAAVVRLRWPAAARCPTSSSPASNAISAPSST